jgi:hypothetical protein
VRPRLALFGKKEKKGKAAYIRYKITSDTPFVNILEMISRTGTSQ